MWQSTRAPYVALCEYLEALTKSLIQNIIFKNGYCSGGHGLSIGSVGGRSDNTVDGVSFLTSTVIDSTNGQCPDPNLNTDFTSPLSLISSTGIRIKTIEDDTGTVTNVEYDDITLENISKYEFPTSLKENQQNLQIFSQLCVP